MKTVEIILMTMFVTLAICSHFVYNRKEVKEPIYELHKVTDLELQKGSNKVIERVVVTDKAVLTNVDSIYYNSLEIGSFINVITYK